MLYQIAGRPVEVQLRSTPVPNRSSAGMIPFLAEPEPVQTGTEYGGSVNRLLTSLRLGETDSARQAQVAAAMKCLQSSSQSEASDCTGDHELTQVNTLCQIRHIHD